MYLSQSRSGPGVRKHVVDDGELQFLSEIGEISSFVASDKGKLFFDNDDMQRGEAQITCKSGDLYQLVSLSLPTHVAELAAAHWTKEKRKEVRNGLFEGDSALWH